MDSELVDDLKAFGLSDYEAKAYVALVRAGTASVTEVSQLCDVPRSNLYATLEGLNKKGFVEIQNGRPIIFKALDPARTLEEAERNAVRRMRSAKESATSRLEKLKAEKGSDAVPALIWGVRGHSSVLAKIREMIGRSKNEVLINLPDLSLLEPMFGELEKASGRGVKIKIATENRGNLAKFRRISLLRIRDKIHGVDVVSDDREVLVAPSLPIAAAWVDNPEMALHVKDFLNLVWKDATCVESHGLSTRHRRSRASPHKVLKPGRR
jgi:sugar-specific transcriptional regulator TrmB